MTNLHQVYKCNICGNIVVVTHTGPGALVCCGQNMVLQEEQHEDQGNEKHVPVVEINGNKVLVKVGSVPHPMEEAHYIEWIEVISNEKVQRVFLEPTTEAKAEFIVDNPDNVKVRSYCNLHGLWQA